MMGWLRQWLCEHNWRPALVCPFMGIIRSAPAKYCDKCDKAVELSEPEFYALFGRIPHIGAA